MDAILKNFEFDSYSKADHRLQMKDLLDAKLRALADESVDIITQEAISILSTVTSKVSRYQLKVVVVALPYIH